MNFLKSKKYLQSDNDGTFWPGYIELPEEENLNNNNDFYNKIVQKNFDNPEKIMKYLNKKNNPSDKQVLLFNHPEFLKA